MLKRKENFIYDLQNEVYYMIIEQKLKTLQVQQKIKEFKKLFKKEVCAKIPNTFWNKKQHVISLPYKKDFNEKNIPTKIRPIQMKEKLLKYCKKEIQDLLNKKLVRSNKLPFICSAFYVQNQAEIEREALRLVINYKSLNKILQ